MRTGGFAAGLLGFEHPVTREHLVFERDPPADMQGRIETLRSQG